MPYKEIAVTRKSELLYDFYFAAFFMFSLEHEIQEKDKMIETLELRLQSKAEMRSIALSPFSSKPISSPSASRRFVETQTSPGLYAKSPQHVSTTEAGRQASRTDTKDAFHLSELVGQFVNSMPLMFRTVYPDRSIRK